MPSSLAKIVSIGVVAIIAFDVLASFASRLFGFAYVYATVGSWLIYSAVGFAVGRAAPVRAASASVAVVALAEATFGWWLSWIIGPGKIESSRFDLTQAATAVVIVVAIGAIIGAAAGAVGHSRRKIEPPGPDSQA